MKRKTTAVTFFLKFTRSQKMLLNVSAGKGSILLSFFQGLARLKMKPYGNAGHTQLTIPQELQRCARHLLENAKCFFADQLLSTDSRLHVCEPHFDLEKTQRANDFSSSLVFPSKHTIPGFSLPSSARKSVSRFAEIYWAQALPIE